MIPIFVALDTPDIITAVNLLTQLNDLVDIKIGLELFIARGPDKCAYLKHIGLSHGASRQMLLDLKLFDTPRTVGRAVRSAIDIEPDFMTLHIAGGIEMMQAAVATVREYQAIHTTEVYRGPKLIGITELTSKPKNDHTESLMIERTLQAREAGLDGVQCSGHEVTQLRQLWPKAFLLTPGIRPIGAAANGQSRISTPKQAMIMGSSALVIGQPITDADDPYQATLNIIQSMQ